MMTTATDDYDGDHESKENGTRNLNKKKNKMREGKDVKYQHISDKEW